MSDSSILAPSRQLEVTRFLIFYIIIYNLVFSKYSSFYKMSKLISHKFLLILEIIENFFENFSIYILRNFYNNQIWRN